MNKLSILIFFATLAAVFACNKGYPGGYGWGWGEPIYLPKPTLIPKLKAAFIDGKLSVDTYKIIAPSLKPLPYKKGVGWLYKGWGLGHHVHGHHGYPHFGYGYGVGKKGHLGLGFKKGLGYGKKAIGLGIGYEKEVGLHHGFGHGHGHFGPDIGHHQGGLGHFPGPIGHHHGGPGHFPGPIGPNIGYGHPGPHGLPIEHHTVVEDVTVVEKGTHGIHHPPHLGHHHGHYGINEIK